MLKRTIVTLGTAMLLVSCVSHPEVGEPVATRVGDVLVIDDQYHLTRAPPAWMVLEPAVIEKTSAYRDRYVFKGVFTGRDITGLQLWAKDFVTSPDVARFVGLRVRDRLADAAADDIGELDRYLDEVAKSVGGVPYTGALIVERYWRRIRRRIDGVSEEVYEYHVLYTVDRGDIDAAIVRAFEEIDLKAPAQAGDGKAARDRVRRVMEAEGLGG